MFAIKFVIQKFDGVINFSRWRIRMNTILTQSGLKKALLGRGKKPQDMKEETWQELDERTLTAIQLCLADEVLDEFSMEKTTSSLWKRLQGHYLKKSLANRLILKQRLFLLRMHEDTPIKSHIAEFFSIINDLDKIEFKIEDEDQALLFLCSLPSSYKSFMEAIIYGGKSTIDFEVKEHLLNNDKIDTQLTGESHHDDSGKVHYSREKSNNGSFMCNSKHKNLTCNYCYKKGHIRSMLASKEKQPNANITELVEGDEEQCDILSVTDRPAGNKDRWVIDSRCSQHISSNRKMFSSYTSVHGEKSSWEILLQAR